MDQIRCIGGDTALLADTLTEERQQVRTAVHRLKAERRTVARGLAGLNADLRRLATSDEHAPTIADLNDQIGAAERRMTEIDARLAELEAERIDAADVAAAFADFDNVCQTLSPREQARVLHLLVRRVEFNVAESTIEVSFHASGIKALAAESLVETVEAA